MVEYFVRVTKGRYDFCSNREDVQVYWNLPAPLGKGSVLISLARAEHLLDWGAGDWASLIEAALTLHKQATIWSSDLAAANALLTSVDDWRPIVDRAELETEHCLLVRKMLHDSRRCEQVLASLELA